jgi:LuxR family transcriptional regulator, maltose regulon positive regulatory protein
MECGSLMRRVLNHLVIDKRSGHVLDRARGAGLIARCGLFEQLGRAGRVTVVSAPAGSGKTVLLRSWIGAAGLAGRAGWVAVQRQERDPQRFWLSVADALRGTAAAAGRVRPVTAAPDLDGWAIVGRLLDDLGRLPERVWLVIDDLHELRSAEALRQLELLVLRGPPELRLLLATRQDLRLGLHGLRLEGELTEVRAADLGFTLDEARALLDAAGVQLPEWALALLAERTEGWAAGLRLAAQSLAGHPDPERAAAEFCGSERTVSDYLLAEVLERLDEEARRLLLRTSLLEWVPGPLADVLTGNPGAERILQDLEQAGAFVVSLNMRRSVFRYHRLFAELLQLELRRTEPALIPELHSAAAGWFTEHGHPVEAIRHAQAAHDWHRAARLLSDQWLGLYLDGQAATAHELLTRFPPGFATDPELAALRAADELTRGSLQQAERHLALATEELAPRIARRTSPSPVTVDWRGRFQVELAIVRMFLARQRGDLPAVAEETQRLLSRPADAGQLALDADLRAMALISLGVTEMRAARSEQAEQHLKQGVAQARRIGRPYLELTGLTHLVPLGIVPPHRRGERRSRQAIELAERHGWSDEPITGVACTHLGSALTIQGRLDEAEPWLDRAQRTFRAEVEPAAGMTLHWARGGIAMARGRHQEALAAFRAGGRLAKLLVTAHADAARMRASELQALVRLGQSAGVEAALAAMDDSGRATGEMCIVLAELGLARGDPRAATAALAPVTGEGSISGVHPVWVIEALLLAVIAYDALGDGAAAGHALERALDLVGSDATLLPFLLHPAPGLLERHARHCSAHAALIVSILDVLGRGRKPEALPGEQSHLLEPLSKGEIRVLRYLPTSLSVPEIAEQLYLSENTVRTHTRHIYRKLGAHRRRDAVERARVLELLAPSPRGT